MGRSLKVSSHHIQRVKNALTRNGFPSQKALIEELGISRDTVRKFFHGIQIDRLYFLEICDKLGLNWQQIADLSEEIPESPDFVGREKAIADLNDLINNEKAKVIVIQAAGGIGKTELARHYLNAQGFEIVIELLMAKETENITSVESVIEEWVKDKFKQEPGREFGITLERLKQQLKTHKVGILIDNLEPALNDKGRLIEPHRRYVELLRVLADLHNQSVTILTSRQCLGESGINVKCYHLDGLDEQAWIKYFTYHQLVIDHPTLKMMRDAYGGNAKAMDIIRGAIALDYDRDMTAYWQENQIDLLAKLELDDLVTTQFERLKENDPNAYRLLCRLGCYSYQNVPTVPIDGLLCLLWDVEDKQLRVIERLKNCGLVEHKKGEYWLHPVIRREGRRRLRKTDDWDVAHCKVMEFWAKDASKEDYSRILEAYYTYICFGDKKQNTAKILTQWAIEHRSKKHDEIAINCHLESIKILEEIESIPSKMSLADAYYQLALTYQDMERIEESQENFNKAIQLFEAIEQPLQVKRVKQSIKNRPAIN